MKVNIGMEVAGTETAVKALRQYLADSFVLYMKTQAFHWNVVSSDFGPLHEMFQKQYEDIAEANDETAERIRILGAWPPVTLAEMLQLASLEESTTVELSDVAMLQALLADHEALCQFLRTQIPAVQQGGDEVTADYFIGRLAAHEKAAWFLRSSLAGRV